MSCQCEINIRDILFHWYQALHAPKSPAFYSSPTFLALPCFCQLTIRTAQYFETIPVDAEPRGVDRSRHTRMYWTSWKLEPTKAVVKSTM